jgi:ATP-dependent DNA helicase RecQ
MLKVLDVDGAVRRVRGGWQATGQDWTYDEARYQALDQVRRSEQQAMRTYQGTTACRMRFLREQLDDPDAVDCGRCDNCGGLQLAPSVAGEDIDAAQARMNRPGVAFEARKIWPTAMRTLGVELAGRVPAGELAEPGRAIARYSGLGHGPRVRQVIAEAAASGDPVPADLIAAAVKVLASWGWEQRPEGVVVIGSLARPQLTASLGAELGSIGRLPVLGTVAHVGASQQSRSNSAQRLKSVWDSYQLSPEVQDTLHGDFAGRPILLVDDFIDTGWTLTVVARLLRRAGAGSVFPLVLAQAS